MGRILKALERAEQERARRADAQGAPSAHLPLSPSPHQVGDADEETGRRTEVGTSERAVPPPPRVPFGVQCEPVTPDRVSREIVALHDPCCEFSEKYRSIRTRLVTHDPKAGARVFAITSPLAREGRTLTVANLGFSLAELRHFRVAMIDLDLRGRGLGKLFGVADRPGMAEVLRGEKTLSEVAIAVVRENLFLVPAGDPGTMSPSELLGGRLVPPTFKEINDRFHFALVDTPPIEKTADIGLIAPMCHAALVVVRMHRTPEPALKRSVKLLQASKVPITGCVLTGCERSVHYCDSPEPRSA